jgi:hypothetical protein
MAGEILQILFPIGLIVSAVLGVIAYKNNWKIAEWF